MNAILRAIKVVGTQARLAEIIGVKQPTVSEWTSGDRPIPATRCVQIEQATKGEVTRKDLRPDDWHQLWPELSRKPRKQKVPA